MARIYIGIGSNINKHENICAGVAQLRDVFPNLQCSQVFESEAVGYLGDNFYNLVAVAQTNLTLDEIINELKKIEIKFGREDGLTKSCPRHLDLDLLLFDDLVSERPIRLPRPELTENAFVLLPMAQLAPNLVHPELNKDYSSLWQDYEQPQKLWEVELYLNEFN